MAAVKKKKAFTIKVTQKHIEKGIRENEEQCPIALAFKEALAAKGLPVDYRSVDVFDTEICVKFTKKLTKEAKKFIKEFDKPEPQSCNYETQKYEKGKDNPAYVKDHKAWKTRVKPFSFSI